MTPFASVAILEKLALLKIALCRTPAFSSASSCRTSVTTAKARAASSGVVESYLSAGMSQPWLLKHAAFAPYVFSGEIGRLAGNMNEKSHQYEVLKPSI